MAGFRLIFSMSCGMVRTSSRTRLVTPRASAVSRPMMPLGASVSGFAFSSALCGAWSVAMISMTPSFKPRRISCLSSRVRSGGFIFARVPCFKTALSSRLKWCGVTSAMTWAPSCLASSTMRTEWPELICWISIRAPVCRASMQSRATRTSSAAAGEPPMPKCSETAPRLMPLLVISVGSSSWKLNGTFKRTASSMAFFTRAQSFNGIPSSVKPAAPWAFNSSMSVRTSPFMPTVILAALKTLIGVFLPSASTYSRVSTLSTGGLVLAMQTTVVNPPAAAAAAPV